MTTEAQIALAREIAGRVYRDIHCDPDFADAVEAGEADGDEAVQAALAAIQATTAEAQSMWRNGITNTAAVIDGVRRKHERSLRRSKAFAEFDADLNAALQSWFEASRSARPTNYNEAEAVWKDHLHPHKEGK
ncbi:hypothetical protein L7H23_01315 [Sphingopyxis sp. BSN-002]|uniref:hypothetical protein n=1 Tax=Sphingopyxis sp. BSN-002 TaxID=2911495 RepID=UPI001EDAD384|nr:hypothetical protein [Sphingopyxis sp. BSN-002]UKK84772.1 hypothetical protein L7H23_01315 [Sphingopyxis sp. BSN-002]